MMLLYDNIGSSATNGWTVLFNFVINIVFNLILFNWMFWVAVILGVIFYFLSTFLGRPQYLKDDAYDALNRK